MKKKILKTFLRLLYVPLKKECHVVLKQVNISKYNFGWSVPLTKKQQKKNQLRVKLLHIPPVPPTNPVPAPGTPPAPKTPPDPGKPFKICMGLDSVNVV